MTADTAPGESRYLTWSIDGRTALVRFRFIQLLRFEEYGMIEAELIGVAETPGVESVVLNFDVMEHFTSRLLGILASLSRKLKGNGRRLAVCRLRPEPLRAFRICRMDILIPCYASEEEARAAVEAK